MGAASHRPSDRLGSMLRGAPSTIKALASSQSQWVTRPVLGPHIGNAAAHHAPTMLLSLRTPWMVSCPPPHYLPYRPSHRQGSPPGLPSPSKLASTAAAAAAFWGELGVDMAIVAWPMVRCMYLIQRSNVHVKHSIVKPSFPTFPRGTIRVSSS